MRAGGRHADHGVVVGQFGPPSALPDVRSPRSPTRAGALEAVDRTLGQAGIGAAREPEANPTRPFVLTRAPSPASEARHSGHRVANGVDALRCRGFGEMRAQRNAFRTGRLSSSFHASPAAPSTGTCGPKPRRSSEPSWSTSGTSSSSSGATGRGRLYASTWSPSTSAPAMELAADKALVHRRLIEQGSRTRARRSTGPAPRGSVPVHPWLRHSPCVASRPKERPGARASPAA